MPFVVKIYSEIKNSFYFLFPPIYLIIPFLLFCFIDAILHAKDNIRKKNLIGILNVLSISQEETFREIETVIDETLLISEETKKQIMEGLELFEKQQLFREKGITQTKLAVRLKTNTKYLSVIIKHNKAENFSLYINRLRVSYIVEKLKTDTKYRKYKISYLADETGYATASSFTRTFRKIIGITPSAYINLQNITIPEKLKN